MKVMKFGAVSVSDTAHLDDLLTIVHAHQSDQLILVCTSVAGITDALINAARGAARGDEAAIDTVRRELWGRHRALAERLLTDEWERETLFREWAELLKVFDRVTRSIATLGERSLRGTDAVAALGERFIAHLVAVLLRQSGIAAQMVDATDLIVTDDSFGAARPLYAESIERTRKRLRPLVQAGIVPVVTGYIGATREGVVTTLGRGGGDYTAALIGAAMDAEEVWIWTDVDGILTADPKIVAAARTLPELSYAEANDIALFGAEVLHPRTLAPLAQKGIVLRICNALRPDHPGTYIHDTPQPPVRIARAIISARAMSVLTLATTGETWTHDLAARALLRLDEAGIEIMSFTRSFNEQSLTMVVRASDAAFASECLAATFERERAAGIIRDVAVVSPVALVAIISAADSESLSPRVLAALGRSRAHVISFAQATVSFHVTFTLPEAEVDEVVRVLHHDLGLA